jgi:hypothetical protein
LSSAIASLGGLLLLLANGPAAEAPADPDTPSANLPAVAPLETALQDAVARPDAVPAFEALFLRSRVYLRITEESRAALQASRSTSEPPPAPQLWIVSDAQTGKPTLELFTSEAAYLRHYPDHPWISMPGGNALRILQSVTIRVTDRVGFRTTWTPEEVAILIARASPPPR